MSNNLSYDSPILLSSNSLSYVSPSLLSYVSPILFSSITILSLLTCNSDCGNLNRGAILGFYSYTSIEL